MIKKSFGEYHKEIHTYLYIFFPIFLSLTNYTKFIEEILMYTNSKEDYKLTHQDPNQPLKLSDLPKKLR